MSPCRKSSHSMLNLPKVDTGITLSVRWTAGSTCDVNIVFSIQDIDTLFDIDSTSHKVTKFIPIPTSSQPYPHHMPPFLLNNPRATSRTHKYRPVNVMPCPRWELAATPCRTIVPQDIACDRYLQNLSTYRGTVQKFTRVTSK
jgi:hypothetical protein